MSQDYLIDKDLREAGAMVNGLENYLKSKEVYGSVHGGFFGFGQMPSLTTGALEMRLRRLTVLREKLDTDQRDSLKVMIDQRDAIRTEWALHYERKLLREANSRLDTMQHYFQEVGQRQDAISIYKPEQLRRTIVQEILTVMDDLGIISAELDAKVRTIDGRLRSVSFEKAGFLWAAELEMVYPEQDYWWLYHRPRLRR